jgi:hypothetical protein
MPLVKCPDCIFWKRLAPEAGNCLRKAPEPEYMTLAAIAHVRLYIPETPATHACGDGEELIPKGGR